MKFSNDQLEQLIVLMNEMFDKKLQPVKHDLRAIRKDLNWVMGRYDTRLNHLEKHLVHPPGRIDN